MRFSISVNSSRLVLKGILLMFGGHAQILSCGNSLIRVHDDPLRSHRQKSEIL